MQVDRAFSGLVPDEPKAPDGPTGIGALGWVCQSSGGGEREEKRVLFDQLLQSVTRHAVGHAGELVVIERPPATAVTLTSSWMVAIVAWVVSARCSSRGTRRLSRWSTTHRESLDEGERTPRAADGGSSSVSLADLNAMHDGVAPDISYERHAGESGSVETHDHGGYNCGETDQGGPSWTRGSRSVGPGRSRSTPRSGPGSLASAVCP